MGSIIYSLPFAVQPLQAAFESIGPRPMEVAATLGAKPLDAFFSVVMPLARPGFFTAAVLTFAHTIGEFGVVLMIGGNIPGKTQTMALAVYTAVQSGNRQTAYLWSLVIVILSALAIVGINYFEKKKYQGEDEGF